MSTNNIQTDAARVAGQKLVARCIRTGRYFNGTNFDSIESGALALRPGTTKEDFRYSWNIENIEVIEINNPSDIRENHAAEIAKLQAGYAEAQSKDVYAAARSYVIKRQREGQKSFAVRMSDGKEYSRRVAVDSWRNGGCAWVNWRGDKIALALIGGELRGDR